jgi:hypothetical protein
MPKAVAPANLFVDFDWVIIGSTFERLRSESKCHGIHPLEPSTALRSTEPNPWIR